MKSWSEKKRWKKWNYKTFISIQGAWELQGEEIPEQLFCEGHRREFAKFAKVFDLRRKYTLKAFELHN